jgi:hypothetical protein
MVLQQAHNGFIHFMPEEKQELPAERPACFFTPIDRLISSYFKTAPAKTERFFYLKNK